MTSTAPSSLIQALKYRYIAVVGMNGSGKSVFGKRLASALNMRRADSDRLFKVSKGDAEAFIKTHGWKAYRSAEEPLILATLVPGTVVILSGGAVESPAIRAALKERAIVIWLQANPQRLHEHLQRAKVARPEFSGGLHTGKIHDLSETRNPHYEEVAGILIPPSVPFPRQVPVAIKELEKYLQSSPAP